MLRQAFGVRAVKSEMELDYCPEGSKKVDYAVSLYAERFGVSVTRAFAYKGEFRSVVVSNNEHSSTRAIALTDAISSADAHRLLVKKLVGCQVSALNVCSESWKR